MQPIEEQQLVDFAAHRVITAFKIVETDGGRFSLVVTVSWKHEDCILTSARHCPRAWASLNTLVRFIKSLKVLKVPITLALKE